MKWKKHSNKETFEFCVLEIRLIDIIAFLAYADMQPVILYAIYVFSCVTKFHHKCFSLTLT